MVLRNSANPSEFFQQQQSSFPRGEIPRIILLCGSAIQRMIDIVNHHVRYLLCPVHRDIYAVLFTYGHCGLFRGRFNQRFSSGQSLQELNAACRCLKSFSLK